jgi:rhomboid protease GluP
VSASRDPDRPIPYISSDMLAPEAAGPAPFEAHMRRFPPVTLAVGLANLAVFGWMLATGALDSPAGLVAAGALVRAKVLDGEIYRLGSALFMHAGLNHLAGNLLMLYVLGMTLEHALGPARMVLVFAVSGLCGSLLSVLGSEGPSVGASGAIFGLAGASWVYFHRLRERHGALDRRIGLTLGVIAAYQLLNGLVSPAVDNWAHAGGLLGGLVLSRLMRVPARPGDEPGLAA